MKRMKTSSCIKIASLGDVHLGHPHTRADYIVTNLCRYLINHPEFQDLDLLLINGDVWDQLLTLTSDAANEAEWFIAYLLKECAKYNIILRVLEGTPLHDCKHSFKFLSLENFANFGCNVRHVDILDIEHIPEIDKTILYLPDELTTNPDTTWELVQKKLAAHGLEQVDYVSMHGAFTYQLPPQAQHNCHDPVRWKKIVKRHIFINHIHTSSQNGPIIAPGSFDRLRHNEEEDKGYVIVNDYGTHSEIKFVTNSDAKIYKTFKASGMALDDVYNMLSCLDEYPDDSHIRILASDTDAIINGMSTLRERWPTMNWSFKREKVAQVVNADTSIFTRYQSKPINRGNFIEALEDKLGRMGIDKTSDYYPTLMNWTKGVVDEHPA